MAEIEIRKKRGNTVIYCDEKIRAIDRGSKRLVSQLNNENQQPLVFCFGNL